MNNEIKKLSNFLQLFYKIEDKIRRRVFGQRIPNFHSFATHIPVLMGLCQMIKPKKILELGPGLYSTAMFTDRSFLPGLTNFTSVESEKEWADKVKDFFVEKKESHFILSETGVADYISSLTEKFDLIFVDDSLTTEDRVRTILNVGIKSDMQDTVVVIHDFEVPAYQNATTSFNNRYIFKCFHPNIGVVWNGNVISFPDMKQLERKIYKRKWKHAVTAFKDWNNLVAKNKNE